MTLNKTLENGVLTFTFEGWLDTNTSADLEKEAGNVKDITKLVFDFDKLEYISSAGLRQVVSFAKTSKSIGAEFSIINANNEVMSVFQMTQLDKKFNITKK